MITTQFVIYIAVGIVSILIDIALLEFLLLCKVHYLTATTFGFISGMLVNFSLHSRVTFKNHYSHRVFIRYIAVVFLNYQLTLALVHFFQKWFSIPFLGKVASIPIITINGFILSKYWIYKNK